MGSILCIGTSLSINRNFLFFSHILFLVVIVILFLLTWIITRKRALLCMGIVLTYQSFIALLDFFFVFLSIIFLEDKSNERVYLQGIGPEKLIAFICSRIIMWVIIISLRKQNIKRYILEYRVITLVIGCVFSLMVRQYQLIITGILSGTREMEVGNDMISLLTTIIVIGMLALFWMKSRVMSKENEFLLCQEKLAKQKYEELEVTLEKNRELVHDAKNHYLVIQEYTERKEYEKLQQYVLELCEEFIKTNTCIYTGNRILDLILGQKQMLAGREQIQYEVQSTLLPLIAIKEQELCALFGNLLDNAIEACKQVKSSEKEISIRIEHQNKMLFIEIVNTLEDIPQKQNGRFLSTKGNNTLHGYGLKSVERIVDAYEGDISYEIKENKFIVSISFFDTE